MAKERLAVGGSESGEAMRDGELEFAEGACGGLAQLSLEFGESHFDGIEIGTVSGEISDGGALGRDQLGHAGDLVRGQIVEDDDVVLFEFRAQDLAKVSGEDLDIDRTFDKEGRRQAVAP